MKKIVTIGGGNGHSSVLKGFYNNLKKNNLFNDFEINAIVSMSDDGRTTGLLMREMNSKLGIHMPPPGDLRRCLFSMSNSDYRHEIEKTLETIIDFEGNISDYTIFEILKKLGESENFIKNLDNHNHDFLDFKMPLDSLISGHKFGNLLMAIIYYNFGDYNKMLDFMSFLLDVKGNIFPITTDKAFIYAELQNGELIETQDNISNVASYNSAIKKIDLMHNSKNAKLNSGIKEAIEEADFLVICPGDLFTSIDTNFIIPGFKELVEKSNSKKIYLLNQTNKRGETTNYTELDFIDLIQTRTGGKLDIVFSSKDETILDDLEKADFLNNISVKGGNYLFIDDNKKQNILQKYNSLEIVTGDYLDKKSLYKNNQKMIDDLIEYIKK